jgi:hypothetical protein
MNKIYKKKKLKQFYTDRYKIVNFVILNIINMHIKYIFK